MWRPDDDLKDMIIASRTPVLRALARLALLSFVAGLMLTWLMGDAAAGFVIAGLILAVMAITTLVESALLIRSMARMQDDGDIVDEEEKG